MHPSSPGATLLSNTPRHQALDRLLTRSLASMMSDLENPFARKALSALFFELVDAPQVLALGDVVVEGGFALISAPAFDALAKASRERPLGAVLTLPLAGALLAASTLAGRDLLDPIQEALALLEHTALDALDGMPDLSSLRVNTVSRDALHRALPPDSRAGGGERLPWSTSTSMQMFLARVCEALWEPDELSKTTLAAGRASGAITFSDGAFTWPARSSASSVFDATARAREARLERAALAIEIQSINPGLPRAGVPRM
jgi:hypothetical protein